MRPLHGVLAESGVYQQPGSGLTIIGSRLLCINPSRQGNSTDRSFIRGFLGRSVCTDVRHIFNLLCSIGCKKKKYSMRLLVCYLCAFIFIYTYPLNQRLGSITSTLEPHFPPVASRYLWTSWQQMHPTSFAPRKRNFLGLLPALPVGLPVRADHRCGWPCDGPTEAEARDLPGGDVKYFLFSPRKLGKMNPFWLIFFRWVETTNFRSCANYVTITSMILVGDGPAASDAASAPAGADHGGELSNKDLTFCIQKSVKIRRICWWTCMKIPWYILGVYHQTISINDW